MSKTTSELLQEREQLASELIALDGELTAELEQKLFGNTEALKSKADALSWAIDRLDAEEIFLKQQAKQFADAAKVRANQAERIKSRIKELMLQFQLDRIQGGSVEFYLTKAKPKLIGEGLPKDYTKQTITVEADKDAIRDAIEDGQTVEGYALQPSHALRTRVSVNSKLLKS